MSIRFAAVAWMTMSTSLLFGQGVDWPAVERAEKQPLMVHLHRLVDALAFRGEPLPPGVLAQIEQARAEVDPIQATRLIQKALDPRCLLAVHINPESRVKAAAGPAQPVLVQGGWRFFLVKVVNEAGVTAALGVKSPQALPVPNARPEQIEDRWAEFELHEQPPMTRRLSGVELEYRLLGIYSRDAGRRAAVIGFDVGQGTQDIGFRNDVAITFTARPSVAVALGVLDEEGKPTTASFIFRDPQGRVYPSQNKRLAPDFFFHPQVYRADGETVNLPPGRYAVEVTRGPEYLPQTLTLEVGDRPARLDVRLERWIDPSKFGYWSGDHHIHAAGCKHYTNPTEGVHAPDMMRHCVGEDLKIGANLTWGPCFDYQKQFFTGAEDKVSQYPYLLRYDIEVSGFGSHKSGHLCLLRLKDQMYPGGESKDHWPTLCLNTYRWAKKQGAVCGPAHSGWGLQNDTAELPSYQVPPFDGIGANEYIMDVTHQVEGPEGKPVPCVDFISTVDTPPSWELNIWYHTLNCGYRTRISGETDFPCIYGERVGLGRGYFKVDGKLTYDQWVEGIRLGRGYVGDGKSHLIDFTVGGVELGSHGSELKVGGPQTVRVTARVAAMLPAKADPKFARQLPRHEPPFARQEIGRPFWDLQWARQGESRNVKLELIVNGHPAASRMIAADGAMQNVSFDVKIERSSWVAMRILPSSHTNPVFVIVGDRPIRASRRSAEWCLKSVDQCWSQKQKLIDPKEMQQAIEAYDHARQEYRRILSESEVD
jgi:hypothetical protein